MTSFSSLINWKEWFDAAGMLCLCVISCKCIFAACRALQQIATVAFTRGIDLKSLGKWAVITGSTDGIGKAFAIELAKRGINIVLVSRNPQKLQKVAKEIESSYRVETKEIAVDFADNEEIFTLVQNKLSGLDIGILVNNVGMTLEYPQFIGEIPSNKVLMKLINVNSRSMTVMTHLVLPGMVDRGRGAVVNVSSGLSLRPTPLTTIYSATKAYVNFFSQGLNIEYKQKGIIVQTLMPFMVVTNMHDNIPASLFVPSAQTYAKSAVRTLGVLDFTQGYVPHIIQSYILQMMPIWLYNKVMMSMMLQARDEKINTKQE